MALTIRPQTAEDCTELRSLETKVFECEVLSLRSFRRFTHSPSIASVVAREDKSIIGYATVFFRKHCQTSRVYSIAVHPDSQGQGIGCKLLKVCEEISRERGSEFLRLEVKADNPTAIAFYQKRGYSQYGIRDAYYEDGTDAILLRKAL